MATIGFSTTGINQAADTLLDQLHKRVGGQKRDLVSNLIVGLLVSEEAISDTILNTGKMANSAFSAGVNPVLFAGVTFPDGHFMSGYSATMTIEKLVTSVNAFKAKVESEAAQAAQAAQAEAAESEGTKKAKK